MSARAAEPLGLGAAPDMTHQAPLGNTHGHNSPLPTTVWLPDADEPNTAPIPGCVLPAWALDKVRTDFVGHSGHQPVPLLKIAIRDMGPGATARIPTTAFTTHTAQGDAPQRMRILLAEIHPDAYPVPREPLSSSAPEVPGIAEDGWPGFFHHAHRLLPDNGHLLLATRQRRDSGRLTDPLGALIAAARTAGFRYLQHIVVAYARPDGDQLVPVPPADASPGVAHCDVIALSVIRHK